MNNRYMISEAAKLIDLEQHTLRYWEDELELDIPRNEMGHRYYRDIDIELLRAVKAFKEKGYQLRAIKMLIPEIQRETLSYTEDIEDLKKTCDKKNLEKVSEEIVFTPIQEEPSSLQENSHNDIDRKNSRDKLEQFRIIMKDLVMETLEENNIVLTKAVNEEVTNRVIKEMAYLLRVKEEREDERYKKLDRTIREVQKSREEAATSNFVKRKRTFRLFK